jgi:deazaflavin-dependent oxidoreductase (nitroreductase family)
MREDVKQALSIGPDAGMAERIVDITTTGRKSQEPRRIETTFHRIDESIYLSGIPMPRPRAWLLNLAADPNFTFHLKHGVTADLPATATVIADATERREILAPIVERFLATRDPNGPFPESSLDDWVRHSPLARVTFSEAD